MKTRVFSGLVMLAFFSAIIIFHNSFPILLNIVVAVVSVVSVYELIKASDLLKHHCLVIPSFAVSLLIPFVDHSTMIYYAIYCCYTIIMFFALIIYHKSTTFKDLAIIYGMSIMIPSALQAIIFTRNLSVDHGLFYTITAVLAAWIPDMGAYFAGTLFGKRKLCPDISPKKTVEGFIGGIIVNMLAMVIIGVCFSFVYYGGAKEANYIVLAIAGMLAAVVSVVGDLSFSLIKRSCGVKDFGQTIPGHGGVLDRFDSVIFTVPFMYFFLYFFPIVVS